MKHKVITFAKVAFASAVITWMFRSGLLDFSVFSEISTPLIISISLIIGLCNLLTINWRWSILLRCQGFEGHFSKTFPLTLIGLFFSYLVPGGVGGDIVKGYYVTRDNPTRRILSLTSLLLDRLFGLYGMIILALVSGGIGFEYVSASKILSTVYLGAVGAFIVLSVFFVVSFSRLHKVGLSLFKRLPVFRTIGVNIVNSLHSYGGGNIGLAVKCVVLSILAQSFTIAFMINIGNALGAELPISTYFFAVPLGFIAMALPVAPAGIGVGQIAYLVLFNEFSGQQSLLGQTAISAFQLTQLCWGLLGAYFYLRMKKDVNATSFSKPLEQS